MHEHYMFGVLTFLLITIALLPKKLFILIIFTSSFLYLRPTYFAKYEQLAPHLVKEKISCIQSFCENRKNQSSENKTLFVNTHSSSHNHQALEYVFLLREFSCQAIDTQEFNATPVDEMLVVADRANFENGKTVYYELSQFCPGVETNYMECKPDLKLYLLEKEIN